MQIAVKPVTLVEAMLPSAAGTQRVAMAFAFSLLIGLSAQLVIPLPFTPVPITGQTFVVLIAGALLGRRLGVLAVLFYLAEGVVGMPVFHSGTSGWLHLFGPTGGYLMGYPVAAYLVGLLAERGWDRGFSKALMMMLLGEAVILLFGVLMLGRFVPGETVLQAGVIPFIPGDLVKSVLAAVVLPSGWKVLGWFNKV